MSTLVALSFWIFCNEYICVDRLAGQVLGWWFQTLQGQAEVWNIFVLQSLYFSIFHLANFAELTII